jgi:1,4-dihydroxy-2-naphthoate octaprenyltransferase
MTTTKKLFLAGGLVLLAGIVLMTLLHQVAWRSFGVGSTDGAWMHQGMPMPHEMPWWMGLGPLAMALSFGGVVILIVSFVRLATRHR